MKFSFSVIAMAVFAKLPEADQEHTTHGNRRPDEVRSQFVVTEARESRREAVLRHFIDIHPWSRMHRQPRPQRPFRPANDDLKGRRILLADPSNRLVKQRIISRSFSCHRIVMAATIARSPLSGTFPLCQNR